LLPPPQLTLLPIPPSRSRLSKLKKHDTSTDCWSIVNAKVYNLTDWISKHPGGSSRINAMCGKNASKGFNAQHASAKAPAFNLAKYQIGVVKKKKKR